MIASAAIRINHAVISMAKPARHHDILRQINALYAPNARPDWSCEEECQGFITHEGVFLDRREALVHTRAYGQTLKRQPNVGYQGDELFSEDLW